ncbi:MAG TPA: M28 family peptidase [Gemmataceae bacterium]|nr:M28 family peptidase [Gemmataceae bacterium]
MTTPSEGWDILLKDAQWARGPGNFPIDAYSEFMPGPWMGIKPYGTQPRPVRDAADPHGWLVAESEQAFELRPGMEIIARELLKELTHLGQGLPTPRIGKAHLRDNPFWPSDLAAAAGKLAHERYLTLGAVALSRTQDDKGRIRWTLFGGSNLGPAAGFWQGFHHAPHQERPAEEGLAFFRQILQAVYGVQEGLGDLVKAGLRILPVGKKALFPAVEEAIPKWCEPLLWNARASLNGVRFLLTFRAFDHLPDKVRAAYLKGELHLLPFPGSLVFWGSSLYRRLLRDLPLAMQTCLLQLFARTNAAHGMRIPQMGWVDYQCEDGKHEHGPHRHRFVRTHRFQRLRRDQEDTEQLEGGDQVSHVIFSTEPHDLGLYNKPMARNVRLWSDDFRLMLDGPLASRDQIYIAAEEVKKGGRFGYRFVFPPMRVGPWHLFWHRPIAAYPGTDPDSPKLLDKAPLGFLTACSKANDGKQALVPLWPRLLSRPLRSEGIELFLDQRQPRWYSEALNLRALVEFGEYLAPQLLPASFARALILKPKGQSLEQWLAAFPEHAQDRSRAEKLAAEIRPLIAPDSAADSKKSLDTGMIFETTMTREFEVDYWQTIATLAHGAFQNKDNADCFQDEPTNEALTRLDRQHRRDLEALGDYLIERHRRSIASAGMTGQAWVGEHAFYWKTDFEYQRWDAWVRNQKGEVHERNIVVRIPGKDSSQAVILADHYDTAYMYDEYEQKAGGTGARVAALGADDNHSATAALLLAAPILLQLSKEGKLECDIWLVHLTGEEFPSDCLGARNLCQALVEGTLKIVEPGGTTHDVSKVVCRGVYVADMIAHNNPHDRNVFQIAPGDGKASAWLAYQAHQANETWNCLAQEANKQSPRKGMGPYVRSIDPKRVPALCPHALVNGEVRPDWDTRSTLYNTDGQIFSDAGVPVVLFMENYDINRSGYHDTHDTVENIDLDYGAAVASIFIESAARAASRKPLEF